MKTHLYRLYTERRAEVDLVPLVCEQFAGATVYLTRGLWQGKAEDSAVIEVIGTQSDLGAVLRLAQNIRQAYAQDAVYVTLQSVECYEVRA